MVAITRRCRRQKNLTSEFGPIHAIRAAVCSACAKPLIIYTVFAPPSVAEQAASCMRPPIAVCHDNAVSRRLLICTNVDLLGLGCVDKVSYGSESADARCDFYSLKSSLQLLVNRPFEPRSL